jgi:dihydropyrimidinase
VVKGRIDLSRFVALTASNNAKLYGLYPRKGTIAVGADADLALWDPDKRVIIRNDDLHSNCGYTPYEGMEVQGWPQTVMSRGVVVVQDGALRVAPGHGRFLEQGISSAWRAADRIKAWV